MPNWVIQLMLSIHIVFFGDKFDNNGVQLPHLVTVELIIDY